MTQTPVSFDGNGFAVIANGALDPAVLPSTVVLSGGAVPFTAPQGGISAGSTSTNLTTLGDVTTAIGAALTGLAIAWQPPILSEVGALPGSPATGDRHILTTTNQINQWSGSAWAAVTPAAGWATWDTATSAYLVFNGTAWADYSTVISHSLLAGLQGGTAGQYYHLTAAASALLLSSQAQHAVLAAPGGAAGVVTARLLDFSDITTGIVPTAQGGTGAAGGSANGYPLWTAGTVTWSATIPYGSLSSVPSSFTPSAHASTHANGGSDQLALDATQITTSQLAPARGGTGLDGSALAGNLALMSPNGSAGAWAARAIVPADITGASAAYQVLQRNAGNTANVWATLAGTYPTIYSNGTLVASQPNLNFIGGSVANSPGTNSVIITLSAGITALTGDVTASGAGSVAATLASVIAAAGPVGSSNTVPVITYDAKGRLTTVTTATITPASIGAVGLTANTFTGKQTTAASTTSNAGLNLPQGSAPTSPVNGDVWTTSAGLYVRIAGATVGPLGTGGGGGGGVTTLNSLTGALTIVAGSGISVTPSGSNITLAVTAIGGVSSINTRGGAVTLLGTDIPVFGASGGGHAPGAVPDPGASTGTTRYLREDQTWDVPPGSGSGVGGILGSAAFDPSAGSIVSPYVDGTIASVAYNSTGNYTVTFAAAEADTNYSVSVSVSDDGTTPSSADLSGTASAYTVNGFTIQVVGNPTIPRDPQVVRIAVMRTGGGSVTGITALTGDVTASGTGSVAATLASVIAAGGPTGSTSTVPVITYDAKGRLTAVTTATITPAAIGAAGLVANTFTGLQTTAASTTGGAGFNLPQGSAPTSPNNGDVWTTSAGLYVRIAGATVGPLGTGGGGGGGVTTVNTRTGDVVLAGTDIPVFSPIYLSAAPVLVPGNDSAATPVNYGSGGPFTGTNLSAVTGPFNDALLFDSASQLVSTGNAAPAMGTGSSWTIALWVKTTASGTAVSLFQAASTSSVADGQIYVQMNLVVAGDIGFNFTNGSLSWVIGGGVGAFVSSIAINDGAWHLVICSKTPTSLVIEIDNVVNNTASIADHPTLANPITWGNDWSNQHYRGSLAEMGFFARALTTGEKTTLFTSGFGGLGGSPGAVPAPVPADLVVSNFLRANQTWAPLLADDLPVFTEAGVLSGTVIFVPGDDSPTAPINYGTGGAFGGHNLTSVAGPFNNGLTFSSGYVASSGLAIPALGTGSSWTICFWMNTTSGGLQCILELVNGSGVQPGQAYVFANASGGAIGFNATDGGGGWVYGGGVSSFVAGTATNDGAWHFMVCAKTPAALTIHVDNLLSGTVSITDFPLANQTAVWGTDWSNQYYNGALAEMQFYSRALTTGEQTLLFTQGFNGLNGHRGAVPPPTFSQTAAGYLLSAGATWVAPPVAPPSTLTSVLTSRVFG